MQLIVRDMKKYFLFLAGLFFSQVFVAQINDPKIGDTVHAIHYNIHLLEVNTNQQTINAFAELTLTPKIDNLFSLPLELKTLTVDSVIVEGVAYSFSHNNEILRIYLIENFSIGLY